MIPACPPNYFWIANKETQVRHIGQLAISIESRHKFNQNNKIKRFYKTNYTEPQNIVNNT